MQRSRRRRRGSSTSWTVTRACWQWSNTFDCVLADTRSDCGQPRFGQCQPSGPPRCVEMDAVTVPPFCNHERQDFSCKIADAVYQTVQNCGTQQFCEDGSCWDTGYPPDADFARTVAYLEAQREAGKYLDPSGLQVFKGFHNTCTKKLFGLVNCCNKGGTNALSMFTNLSLALNAISTVGKASFSSYTYDALFTSDAPGFAITGFEALFGTGLDSGLAGLLAGDLAVGDFIIVAGALVLDDRDAGDPVLRDPELQRRGEGDRDEARRAPVRRVRRLLLAAASASSASVSPASSGPSRIAASTRTWHGSSTNRGERRSARAGAATPRAIPIAVASASPSCRASTFLAWTCPSSTRRSRRRCLDAGTAAGNAAARVPACYFGNGQC